MRSRSLIVAFVILCLASCGVPITPSPLPPPTASPTAASTGTPTPPPTVSLTASLTLPLTASATAPPTASPTVSPTAWPTLSLVERLQRYLAIDVRCPYFCWLGINPGVTSAAEVRSLFEASNKITQINATLQYLGAVWQDDTYVSVYFEKSLVKSIYLYGNKILNKNLGDLTLIDFIQFLGEPDEIGVVLYQSPHCEYVLYSIYYSSRKLVIAVSFGSWNGPNPIDPVDAITLNTEFAEYLQRRYLQPPQRQPWLGYGHLSDYLPRQRLPTGPCVMP